MSPKDMGGAISQTTGIHLLHSERSCAKPRVTLTLVASCCVSLSHEFVDGTVLVLGCFAQRGGPAEVPEWLWCRTQDGSDDKRLVQFEALRS